MSGKSVKDPVPLDDFLPHRRKRAIDVPANVDRALVKEHMDFLRGSSPSDLLDPDGEKLEEMPDWVKAAKTVTQR